MERNTIGVATSAASQSTAAPEHGAEYGPANDTPGGAIDSLERIRGFLPDYARDLRLNLGSVLTPEGAPGLSEPQIWSVAVASAIAARNPTLARALEAAAGTRLDAAHLTAARTAAAIMGMNNIYYRFVHLVEDDAYRSLPARLRMNALAAPPVAKVDFELLSLAVSAVNGCGMCISAHQKNLRARGALPEAVQSAVRIAAVVYAAAVVAHYEVDDHDCPRTV